ncbi:FAD-dependent oxidoreductase [Spirilliplanes yamanashiensis]|uniref:D-amino-acid oxidase n=1 Tax=Spirilliplanes yamanashiensis TaxID=42233 RepID=A0A8J3YCL8_9ACTN|nr:FAD-dependent oxidoreductase [Spirilliplanes yamanashiensis]MDP9818984.1 D-amino-acid oxidase [Spirilliplanes yamanashiensis]GIJ05439.1 amino acid oxidase [Spirilliplanes yamanashiensis]
MTGATDVIVVGGGVVGLTAAVRLLERGARVTVLTADDPADVVSSVAAAVWYPTRTDPDPRVLSWAAATYAEFTRQAATGVPGVSLHPTRNLLAAPAAAAPWWAPAAGGVVLAGAEVRFTAPLAEMGAYLPWLAGRVSAAGGRVERRRVRRLAELSGAAPVVVNATGLAARELCGDAAVHPARGRVVLVANPGIDVSVRAEGDPVTYVHPRARDVVLGGTYEPGEWDVRPDPAVSAAIVRRCVALVPELAGAPVLAERTGLRPVRTGGPRVERETAGGTRVVHAYGHGGAGMTLSWGCADTVADLALGA